MSLKKMKTYRFNKEKKMKNRIRNFFMKKAKIRTCKIKTIRTSTVVMNSETKWTDEVKRKLAEQLVDRITEYIKIEMWTDGDENRIYETSVKIIIPEEVK